MGIPSLVTSGLGTPGLDSTSLGTPSLGTYVLSFPKFVSCNGFRGKLMLPHLGLPINYSLHGARLSKLSSRSKRHGSKMI